MIHPVSPHYSLLLKFDPDNYPKVVGDLAESWTVSPRQPDLHLQAARRRQVPRRLDAHFARRQGQLRPIIAPPEGVTSARKAVVSAPSTRIDAPDPQTVVFKLKYPSPAMLSLFASPWNYIYSAAALEKDPKFPEKNVMGTGPFTFVEYVPGSHWVGKRFDDYFEKGKPYLDCFRAMFIRETAAQEAAVRGERRMRRVPRLHAAGARPDRRRRWATRSRSRRAPGSVICSPRSTSTRSRSATCASGARCRWRSTAGRAHRRWARSPSRSWSAGWFVRVGRSRCPSRSWSSSRASRRTAKPPRRRRARCCARRACPEGFAFVFKNRDVPAPYEPVGVFLIDQWRKIGLNVTQQVLETTSYFNDIRSGNFDVMVDFQADYMDEPDLHLGKFISFDKNSSNYARYTDRTLDDLYDKQTRESDPEKRKQLVWEFERRVLDEQAYIVMTPWWQRIIPHSAKLKGWKITAQPLPESGSDQRLADRVGIGGRG